MINYTGSMVFRKKYFLVPFSFVFVLLLLGYGLFQVSRSRTFQFFSEITSRVETSEKVVALTFDDAPTKYTEDVLRTLKEKQVKATFYVIGGALEEYPEQGRRIVEDGHELGNHSYSHKRFLLKSHSFIADEIQKTNKLIKESGYLGEITFRPPNGKKLFGLPMYLNQQNIKTIMWDVEPDTYLKKSGEVSKDTEFIVNYTLEKTKPGSIILIHPFCDSCQSDREAIVKIIEGLEVRGFKFVTVSELLSY